MYNISRINSIGTKLNYANCINRLHNPKEKRKSHSKAACKFSFDRSLHACHSMTFGNSSTAHLVSPVLQDHVMKRKFFVILCFRQALCIYANKWELEIYTFIPWFCGISEMSCTVLRMVTTAPQVWEDLPGIVYSPLWCNLQRQAVFQILQTLTKEKSTNI